MEIKQKKQIISNLDRQLNQKSDALQEKNKQKQSMLLKIMDTQKKIS